MKFKLLSIKFKDDLESKVNDFIEGKDIVSLEILKTPGSILHTHEVHITHKEHNPDQMIEDFSKLIEMIAMDVSAGWDANTIDKKGYKFFVQKYAYIVSDYLHAQIDNTIIED